MSLLRGEPRINQWLNNPKNWIDVLEALKSGDRYEDGTIVFF